MAVLPTHYLPPLGTPLYWQHEVSGRLAAAIVAYERRHETPAQLALVIAYCRYWVQAPCWAGQTLGLALLRQAIQTVTTRPQLEAWLGRAATLGIDPF